MTTFGLSVHTAVCTHVRTQATNGRLTGALDVSAFTIYSAPRVDDAVGYLVDIVYLGLCSGWLRSVIRVISLLNVTYRP